jgi:hypothetical protein
MFLRSRGPILLLALLLFSVSAIFARPKTKGREVTVTGCLQSGNTVDRFILRGPDRKAYALRSGSVKLSEHVGHRVTIKGELKHDQKRDDYDFEGSEVNEEYGKGKVIDPLDVEVSSLKVVSASCQ